MDGDRPTSSSRFRGKDGLSDRRPRSNLRDRDSSDKSSEMMWLTYETKLRTLMQDLLQPTVKRSREDRELYDNLMYRCEVLTKRVEDLETITHKAEVKQTIFDDIFKRINNLDTLRKSDISAVHDRINKVEADMSTIGNDYNFLRDSLKSVQEVTQKLSEDFSNTTIHLDEYKKSYSKLVADLQKNINQNAEFQKAEKIKIEEKFQVVDNSIMELRSSTGSHDHLLQSHTNHINEIISKLAQFEKEVADCNSNIENFAKYIDAIKGLKTKAETVEIKSRTIENYLEKYLPIFTQAQISESLHHCLPSTNKRKLLTYEEKKFREMNNDVLIDDGNPDLQKRIESMYIILETTVKRYSKSLAANNLGIKFRESETIKHEGSSRMLKGRASGGLVDSQQATDRTSRDQKPNNINLPQFVNSRNDGDNLESSRRESRVLDATSGKNHDEVLPVGGSSPRFKMGDEKMGYHESRSKTSEAPGTIQQVADDVSDAGSDLDEMQSRQIKKLQDDVVAIKEEHAIAFKRLYDEMNHRMQRISADQLEISENSTMSVKNALVDVQKFINERKKEELDKVIELEGLYEGVKRNEAYIDKVYQFVKKLNEVTIPLIETVNGLLVITLKEEKEKKNFIGILQGYMQGNNTTQVNTQVPTQVGGTRTNEDVATRKKKELENAKRMVDLPYLSGNKVGAIVEEKSDLPDFEVKLKFNDRLVKKVEFLELTFETFKGCLSFSTKFRLANNFAQFFEGETSKGNPTPRKALKPVRGTPHLLYEEKSTEIPTSTSNSNAKPTHSKLASMSYKNYVSEGVGIKLSDSRGKSPAGTGREYGVNRSFY